MEVVTLDIIGAVMNSLNYASPVKFRGLKKRIYLSSELMKTIDEGRAYQASLAALLKEIGNIKKIVDLKEPEKGNYKSVEILRKMPGIIPMQYSIADIILDVDERIDGSGFPSGKTKVASEAQVIGIIESYFEALDIEKLYTPEFNEKYIKKLDELLKKEEVQKVLNSKELLDEWFEDEKRIFNVYKEEIEGVEEEQFLETIASIIDAGHSYTAGHTKRVASYSFKIAKDLGYEGDELIEVRYAAYLHDIGKLVISEELLNKPGKLTEKEYEMIKKHAEYSYKILEASPRLKRYSAGALHHERIDGKGYPFGLKGDEIPEVAKIIAIVDILDALTSNRPYRNPATFKEAFNIMESMVDIALDREIFEVAKISFDIID